MLVTYSAEMSVVVILDKADFYVHSMLVKSVDYLSITFAVMVHIMTFLCHYTPYAGGTTTPP